MQSNKRNGKRTRKVVPLSTEDTVAWSYSAIEQLFVVDVVGGD